MELLKGRRLATLRAAVFASVGVHGALVVAATLMPLDAAKVEAAEVVMLDVVDVAPPPEEPSAPPPPPAAAPKARAPRAIVAEAPVEPTPAPPTAPVVEAAPEPEPTAPVVEAAAAAAPTGGTGAPGGAVGGVSGGVAGGVPGGTGVVPRPVDEAQRRMWLGRYRELMRGRIGATFQYPAAARELELAGEVVVEITVDRQGALKRARLRAPCPHTLLCDDALRTVRAAAPFPPLPPDLAGEAVAIDVPLRYDFE
jgi:protein TonB